ncbi:interaptin-like [Leptopilina boulardi]|uniref:interaptin-like n=1 Tax=Leptopilina boulardi TaxID=63433 RepID=UPI0021F63E24|nr:interaptin-like [Leptopilina boulardi]XP_051167621.1 interaptin-like [Leptopilina boulardi]
MSESENCNSDAEGELQITHAYIRFFDDKTFSIVPVEDIKKFNPSNVEDFKKDKLYKVKWDDKEYYNANICFLGSSVSDILRKREKNRKRIVFPTEKVALDDSTSPLTENNYSKNAVDKEKAKEIATAKAKLKMDKENLKKKEENLMKASFLKSPKKSNTSTSSALDSEVIKFNELKEAMSTMQKQLDYLKERNEGLEKELNQRPKRKLCFSDDEGEESLPEEVKLDNRSPMNSDVDQRKKKKKKVQDSKTEANIDEELSNSGVEQKKSKKKKMSHIESNTDEDLFNLGEDQKEKKKKKVQNSQNKTNTVEELSNSDEIDSDDEPDCSKLKRYATFQRTVKNGSKKIKSIHLGEGVNINYDVWEIIKNKKDNRKFVKSLAIAIWGRENLVNRYVKKTDGLIQLNNRSPRKPLTPTKRQVLEKCLEDHLTDGTNRLVALKEINGFLSEEINSLRKLLYPKKG